MRVWGSACACAKCKCQQRPEALNSSRAGAVSHLAWVMGLDSGLLWDQHMFSISSIYQEWWHTRAIPTLKNLRQEDWGQPTWAKADREIKKDPVCLVTVLIALTQNLTKATEEREDRFPSCGGREGGTEAVEWSCWLRCPHISKQRGWTPVPGLENSSDIYFSLSVQEPSLWTDSVHNYSESSHLSFTNLYHRHAQRLVF